MKKILSLFAGLAVAGSVYASDHMVQSFIRDEVHSIQVSNDVAMSQWLGVTNLDVPSLFPIANTTPTNSAFQVFTNAQLALVSCAASYSNYNLFRPITLIPVAGGNWEGPTWAGTGQSHTYGDSNVVQDVLQSAGGSFKTAMSLLIKVYTKNAAADAPINFRFAGSPNGIDVPITPDNIWTVGVDPPAVTGGTYMICTNIPTFRWPGYKTLWLLDIDNTDQTANSAVWVQKIQAVGWGM